MGDPQPPVMTGAVERRRPQCTAILPQPEAPAHLVFHDVSRGDIKMPYRRQRHGLG